MHRWEAHYIGGRWQAGDGAVIAVDDAVTGRPLGCVPSGNQATVDAAVGAAADAFVGWAETSVKERAEMLRGIADALVADEQSLAELMAREVGTPIAIAKRVQVGLAVAIFRSMADLAEQVPAHERLGTSVVLRHPVGVVAAITPWNYPLYQLAAKVAPAMAAGCTTVVKPSSAAPLAAFEFARIIDALGLPAGVVNVISGPGSTLGEALVAHPAVDMVSLTGSTAAGARVAEIAARDIKKVTLELGGKSAFVLLDGAELQPAVSAAVRGCFVNNGQTCSATTRLLVPEHQLGAVEDIAAGLVAGFTVGDPLDPSTDVGPLVSAAQQRSVRGYLALGADEGVVLTGGSGAVPGHEDAGYFVRPTVISRLAPEARVVREEIFGPALSIVGYSDVDEAVRLADDSEYGLSGAVWGPDIPTATGVARRLRTGQVAVNGGRFNPEAPFGGYRKSGVGRELGPHGLAEYFELTSLQFASPADADSASAI
jgi:aldehyde dehydrogenase (NAD+)